LLVMLIEEITRQVSGRLERGTSGLCGNVSK